MLPSCLIRFKQAVKYETYVTARSDRSLNALLEVEKPVE